MKYSILFGLVVIICILTYIINTIENISKLKETFINNNIVEHNTNKKCSIEAKEGILKDIGKDPDRNWGNVKNMIKKYEDYEPQNYNTKCTKDSKKKT